MKTAFDLLRQTRTHFLRLLEGHSLATLNLVPVGYNNNLVWNYGHVVVTQQLLVYGPTGQAFHVEESLVEKYRRGSKPDGKANSAEVERLRELGLSTLDALEADYVTGCFSRFEPYTTGFGVHLANVEDALRFLPAHECLHLGYAMALKRMLS